MRKKIPEHVILPKPMLKKIADGKFKGMWGCYSPGTFGFGIKPYDAYISWGYWYASKFV